MAQDGYRDNFYEKLRILCLQAKQNPVNEPAPPFPFLRSVWPREVAETKLRQFFQEFEAMKLPVIGMTKEPVIPNLKFVTSFVNLRWNGPMPKSMPTTMPMPKPKTAYAYIDLPLGRYERVGILSDYFSEPQRVLAKRFNSTLTPMEMWQCSKIRNKIKELKMKAVDLAPEHLIRAQIYATCKMVSVFEAIVAKAILDHFQAKRVLDFCAGWGDRLVGALASSSVQHYTGVDANPGLHEHYREISQLYAKNHHTVNFLTGDFLDSKVLAESPGEGDVLFDTILTSPPYFDLELYSQDANQSVVRFPTFEAWVNKFLFAALNKAWCWLEPGGHMIISINDHRLGHHFYCEAMVLYCVGFLSDCHFLGVITYMGVGKKDAAGQPLWIFRKQANTAIPTPAQARKALETHFLKRWRKKRKAHDMEFD